MNQRGFIPAIIIIVVAVSVIASGNLFYHMVKTREAKEVSITPPPIYDFNNVIVTASPTIVIKSSPPKASPTPAMLLATKEPAPTKTSASTRPVLKNLGVNIEPLNKQTNLAGDLLFDQGVVYDDGRVANDKVFLDFGHKDKYRTDSPGNIEYWFYVPLNTKVRAPVSGTVQVGFIEHTKDWGINIVSGKDYQWIVSFEHLVNLTVKDGDLVNVGDVVGDAGPRIANRIAMVELAVWTGGQSILKYCPYDFLEESLKPIYKEKINQLAKDWEEFIGKDIYKQEVWVAPGCLMDKIIER